MVRKKQQASKSTMTQPMDSPPISDNSTKENDCQKVEVTVEMRNLQKQEMRAEQNEEITSEESTLRPLLRKGRSTNQQ